MILMSTSLIFILPKRVYYISILSFILYTSIGGGILVILLVPPFYFLISMVIINMMLLIIPTISYDSVDIECILTKLNNRRRYQKILFKIYTFNQSDEDIVKLVKKMSLLDKKSNYLFLLNKKQKFIYSLD